MSAHISTWHNHELFRFRHTAALRHFSRQVWLRWDRFNLSIRQLLNIALTLDFRRHLVHLLRRRIKSMRLRCWLGWDSIYRRCIRSQIVMRIRQRAWKLLLANFFTYWRHVSFMLKERQCFRIGQESHECQVRSHPKNVVQRRNEEKRCQHETNSEEN